MKLVFEVEGERATKCYYILDSGERRYADFWQIKTDCGGWIQETKAWGPENVRKKNYATLRFQRQQEAPV